MTRIGHAPVDVTPQVQDGRMLKKRCADCKQYKLVEEFPRNKNCKDGYHCYCKACNNARTRESRERLHGGTRHYHLMHRYGIGADEFDELVKQQGGVCPLCGRENPEHVDHDHETGEVRGILCFNCNGGLGQFRDSIDALLNAVSYLTRADPENRELDALALERARGLLGSPV
jgi:Recombination endonuclease VII